MFITGVLCIISAVVAVLRNIKGNSVLYGQLGEMQELSSEEHLED